MYMEDNRTLEELLKLRDEVADEYARRPSNLTAKYRLEVLDEKIAEKLKQKEAAHDNEKQIF